MRMSKAGAARNDWLHSPYQLRYVGTTNAPPSHFHVDTRPEPSNPQIDTLSTSSLSALTNTPRLPQILNTNGPGPRDRLRCSHVLDGPGNGCRKLLVAVDAIRQLRTVNEQALSTAPRLHSEAELAGAASDRTAAEIRCATRCSAPGKRNSTGPR
jgi:hypothetical protein